MQLTDQIKTVMPPFFVVKIPKKEQRERLEKIGVLYYPPEWVFMKRGMQCGEIVAIGSDAHSFFPEAKIGDILICHHFIEGKTMTTRHEKFFLIHNDDDWNYYCVTAFTYNGDRNNTFGVWDGNKIIPSKEYIFFDIDEAIPSDFTPEELTFDGGGNGKIIVNIPMARADGGLIIPKTRRKTRSELIEKSSNNMIEMKRLGRWMGIAPEKAGPMLKRLERENEVLSKEINTRKYESHIVAAFNDKLLESVHPDIKNGDRVFVLNIATYMQIEFMGKEYIVSESKYVVMKDPQIPAPNKAPALLLY